MALILLPALVVAVAAPLVYLRGGDRLSGAGGNVTGPVTIGEEFHTMVQLDTGGGSVELVSARPSGVTAGLEVEVRLLRLGARNPIGSERGPLGPGFQQVALSGHELRSSYASDPRYALDVRVIATAPGQYQMTAVEVTYRDGLLRERTVSLPAALCVDASADWSTAPRTDCPLPAP